MNEKKEESVEFLCACVANIVDRKNRAEAEVVRLRKRVECIEDVLPNIDHIHALADDICRTLGTEDLSEAAMEVQRLKQIADIVEKPKPKTVTVGVGTNANMLYEVLGSIKEAVESIPGAKLDFKEVDA